MGENSVKTVKIPGTNIKNANDKESKDLLGRKISDLSLKIQGTHLESLVDELYRELEKAGISFKPKTYLSDEWGCPHGVPVIGIPFYLADPELCKLEHRLTGIEAENESEIMMYLRHETGHAFNYAYRLFSKPGWRTTFGQFSRSYEEEYKPIPFDARFVRHIPGWYAQKHPDDDFAETFAVWLTPGSDWREHYSRTPALSKLLYVEKIVHRYGQESPMVTDAKLDKPVQKLTMTLDSWYEWSKNGNQRLLKLHNIVDEDLRQLFPGKGSFAADQFLQSRRGELIRQVNFWTGMERHLLIALFDTILTRVRELDLKLKPGKKADQVAFVTAFLTTLVMNYQLTGKFIEG
jgi:hypothetical protein